MILLEINPLATSIAEIVILLVFFALVGYLAGRWITKGRFKELSQLVSERTAELEECRTKLQIPGNPYAVSEDVPVERDNLRKILGIGPRLEKLLNDANIFTFAQLAAASPATLSAIFSKATQSSAIDDSQTWITQAALARDGKWGELEILQDRLSDGENRGDSAH